MEMSQVPLWRMSQGTLTPGKGLPVMIPTGPFYGMICLLAKGIGADLRNLSGSHGPCFVLELHPKEEGGLLLLCLALCGPQHSLTSTSWPPSALMDVSVCGFPMDSGRFSELGREGE